MATYEDLVKAAYESIGRVGEGTAVNNYDQDGYNYWLGELNSGALDPNTFSTTFNNAVSGVLASQPTSDLSQYVANSLVNNAYADIGRTDIGTATNNIDQSGSDYWNNQLLSGALNVNDFQPTFNDAVGGVLTSQPTSDLSQYVVDQIVRNAYADLGRTDIGTASNQIDKQGYDYWTQQLLSGALNPNNFQSAFNNSAATVLAQQPNTDLSRYVIGTGYQPVSLTPTDTTGGTSGDATYGYSGGAASDMQKMTNAIQGQLGSNVQSPNPLGTVGGIDLTSAYKRYINGDAGANPYLTAALQRGADQATNTYQQMLRDQAQTFNEQIMPTIRNNAIHAGGIGGARQGIAEGMAKREFDETTSDLALKLGQDVNSAVIGGQANAWMQGNQLGANLANNLSQQNVYGQLATNTLNQNAINAGINNQQNWFNAATGLASGQDSYALNRLNSAMNALNPYAQMTSTQSTITPYFNNPYSTALGGTLAGAQIGNLLF